MHAVDHVLVVGGGSAGFLAAITLKAKIPGLEVTVVRSKEIGIIGVGEGTTIVVPKHLHGYLGLPMKEFHEQTGTVWKLGIRFLWGPRPWFDYAFSPQMDTQYQILPKMAGYYVDACGGPDGPFDYVGIPSGMMTHDRAFLRQDNGLPLWEGSHAYHIENEMFVTWLEGHARRLGVRILDETITEVLQDEQGITGLRFASGPVATADLYVDCSGFASLLLGKAFGERFESFRTSLYCDRAVVGGWKRQQEVIKPYTTAETMDCGWCWQIEHENRINRGYVYASSFISDEEAEREFRAKNPKVERTRVVKYVTGRYDHNWVKNVVAIGNASGFVEPLESTALAVICNEAQWLTETLIDTERRPTPSQRNQYNRRVGRTWDSIRQFLAIHYKFNTRLDTPFWVECREKTDLCTAGDVIAYYQENGPSVLWRKMLLDPDDQFGMEGYLSMFVGMRVPHQSTWRPSDRERESWARIRQVIRDKVTHRAMGVREALTILRHPQYVWPTNVYR